jgi:hypothetical protein
VKTRRAPGFEAIERAELFVAAGRQRRDDGDLAAYRHHHRLIVGSESSEEASGGRFGYCQPLSSHAEAGVDGDGCRERKIAFSEDRDALRHAVFTHVEVFGPQPGHRAALFIRRARVDFNLVDARCELRRGECQQPGNGNEASHTSAE